MADNAKGSKDGARFFQSLQLSPDEAARFLEAMQAAMCT